jgi:hypothetical protein
VKTMTEPSPPSSANDHPARTLGARDRPQLVDTSARVAARLEREATLRRAVFVASLAGFVAVFGLVAVKGEPGASGNVQQPALPGDTLTANRVLAEVPVTDANGAPMIIRVVTPDTQTTRPHVRTRATP